MSTLDYRQFKAEVNSSGDLVLTQDDPSDPDGADMIIISARQAMHLAEWITESLSGFGD